MQINNNINTPSKRCVFTAGISHNLYKKIVPNNSFEVDVVKKVDDIYNTNHKAFVLADAVYNVKEKVGEFILTAVDTVKFLPGLENVQSKVVKSKGKDIAEAFQNIDLKELKQANDALASDYSQKYQETIPLREKIQAQKEALLKEYARKFDEDDSFWANFYRNQAKNEK